jgi:hypothetical protein
MRESKKQKPNQDVGALSVIVVSKCEFVAAPTSLHYILGAVKGKRAYNLSRSIEKAEKRRKKLARHLANAAALGLADPRIVG